MADKAALNHDIQLKCVYLHNGQGAYFPYVALAPAAESNVTSVDASDSSVTLKAANSERRSLLVFNDGSTDLYLKYGETASTTDFTVKIASGGYWEMPLPAYQGVVDGIWSGSPTGAAKVTELS